jgi:hypothetical protein
LWVALGGTCWRYSGHTQTVLAGRARAKGAGFERGKERGGRLGAMQRIEVGDKAGERRIKVGSVGTEQVGVAFAQPLERVGLTVMPHGTAP